jgi:hypothetical protein
MLRSDEVRKDLAGMGHLEPSGSGLDRGIHGGRETLLTYEEILGRARRLLELGESVLLDASWADERFRTRAHTLASTVSAELVELRCDVDPETTARRIAARTEARTDPSDATPEIAEVIRRRFDPWPSAIRVTTSGSPRESLDAALRAIDRVTASRATG